MNYLYNGVELPALPEWDKTVYPYAVITKQGGESAGYAYFLYCTASPTTATALSYLYHAPFVTYALKNGEWAYSSEHDSDYGGLKTVHSLVWADHDVYKGSTIVLSASATIPVPTYDPTALLMGYRVGCALRAMRGKQ